MIKTTYTCDRCGHSQDTNNQMWYPCFKVCPAQGSLKLEWAHYERGKHELWCRKCIDTLGLLGFPKPPPNQPEPVRPTFEDQLREIIRYEIDGAKHGT